ncbi:IclR family transcriptional regulator [Variovorax sp. KK3]|uniref:IclR family transcriptional regulator n=1 Tax=Variovorax sp. KK3 TaxID=1855728 RepID=UPI00097BC55D|nr:IclR family transcriptional regulator [Variovorax sp. KK3]
MARPSGAAGPASGRAPADKAGQAMVTPFARAMELLWAFTPQDRWLGNRELAQRTGLPASTVSRIAQTLVLLGYLHHDAADRKYRLAPPVLALGYGAIANSGVQRAARQQMQAMADQHRLHVNLSSRDRLDLIVLESCSGAGAPLALNLHAGVRVGIASSPMGWALLAALPELERYYLLENVERRMPREWPRLRRRSSEAIAQVHQLGFCASLGEWDAELGIIAAPLVVEHHAPLVVACVGSSAQMTRARVERELGPKLLAAVSAVQQKVGEA